MFPAGYIMLFLSDQVEKAWAGILFYLPLLSRIYTSWNLLEWFLGPLALEIILQEVNLGLNNLVKLKEMSCLNERIMSIPLALTKVYFVKNIVCVLENSLTYIKVCHWTKHNPELKTEGKNVLVMVQRWKICPFILPITHPITAAYRGDSKHWPLPAQGFPWNHHLSCPVSHAKVTTAT